MLIPSKESGGFRLWMKGRTIDIRHMEHSPR